MKKFIVRSLDSYDEKSYEIVRGNKIESEEELIYEYISKLGKCKITVLENRLIVDRDNNGIATILDIDMAKETKFVYYGENFKKIFTLKGEKISYNNNSLEFSYKIFDNGQELNFITITIKEY